MLTNSIISIRYNIVLWRNRTRFDVEHEPRPRCLAWLLFTVFFLSSVFRHICCRFGTTFNNRIGRSTCVCKRLSAMSDCVQCFSRCKLSLNKIIVYLFAVLFFLFDCVCATSSCFYSYFFLSLFKFMGKMLINQIKIVNCMFKWLYYKYFLLIFRHSWVFASPLWREKNT